MDAMAAGPDIREVLRQVLDPEIGVNIVDLGLVYRITLLLFMVNTGCSMVPGGMRGKSI
jgi:metal-sulfur cluster biosynthetic enzyme